MDRIKVEKSPTAELPHIASEDVVLFRLHRCTDGTANCSPHDAEIMHRDFETCEAFVVYELYKNEGVPTLTNIETRITNLIESIPENLLTDTEGKRLTQLLKGRSLVIRGNVRSYVESVVKFVRLQNTAAVLRDPEIFVKMDHERRRKHDNLLRSLTDTQKLFIEAFEYGLIPQETYQEWSPGETSKIPENIVPIFSTSAIANRDLIKNWALAADFAEHFEKLTDLLSNKE